MKADLDVNGRKTAQMLLEQCNPRSSVLCFFLLGAAVCFYLVLTFAFSMPNVSPSRIVNHLFAAPLSADPNRTFLQNKTAFPSRTTGNEIQLNTLQNKTISPNGTTGNGIQMTPLQNETISPNRTRGNEIQQTTPQNAPPQPFIKDTDVKQFMGSSNRSNEQKSTKKCPLIPNGLVGEVLPKLEQLTPEQILAQYPYVARGGKITPSHCVAEQKVAIIIPYRDRLQHLHIFLNHLFPILHRQNADVQFFVIEQANGTVFNRAALFNIGFLESLKLDKFDCFIFHDVDMLPLNDNNLYRCAANPRHFTSGFRNKKKLLPYKRYFGGVVGMSANQYRLINGNSNLYFGWGGEDDDLLIRCERKGLKWFRLPVYVGWYHSISHSRDKGNEANADRFRMLEVASMRQYVDGLNSVKYKDNAVELRPLYTLIHVQIDMKGILQAAPESVKKIMKNLMSRIR